MKKILALALAVVFMFALAIPAFATTTLTPTPPTSATGDLTGDEDNVVITYNVSGKYVVSVPAALEITTEDMEPIADVVATEVLIKLGQKLTVTVSSTDGFALEYYGDNEEATAAEKAADSLAYSIEVGTLTGGNYDYAPLGNDGLVLTVNENGTNAGTGAAGETAKLKFDFTSIEDAKYQGIYKDTITFTVTVGSAN